MCTSLFQIYKALSSDIVFAHPNLASVFSDDDSRDYSGSDNGALGEIQDRINVLLREEQLTPSEFACLALYQSIGKKLLPTSGDCQEKLTREASAFRAFLDSNHRCKHADIRNDLIPQVRRQLEDLLQWSDLDGTVSYEPPMRKIVCGMRAGPGASNGSKGNDFLSKITGPMAFTSPDVRRLFLSGVGAIQHIEGSDGERTGYPTTWCEAENLRTAIHGWDRLEYSLTAFVPKTTKTDRMIATEPCGNMFLQLGVADVLSSFLTRWGIHIPTQQEKNKTLARTGSIQPSHLATIDLSSASDSVSITLIEALFPKGWVWLLKLLRCGYTRVNDKPHFRQLLMETNTPFTEVDGTLEIELGMISTMGNGFTFALETLIFYAICLSCYRVLGLEPKPGVNLGVYGDDIIVHTQAFPLVIESLRAFGFIPNESKTFSIGGFRESCGVDFFHGTPVRGVYAQSLSTPQERVSLVNRLNRWSALHCVYFPTLCRTLLSSDEPAYSAFYDGDDSGIHITDRIASFLGIHRDRPRQFICNRLNLDNSQSYGYVVQVYKVRSERTAIIRDGELVGSYGYNPAAALHASLGGYVSSEMGGRNSWVSLRILRKRYKKMLTFYHCFDRVVSDSGLLQCPDVESIAAWETAILYSLPLNW